MASLAMTPEKRAHEDTENNFSKKKKEAISESNEEEEDQVTSQSDPKTEIAISSQKPLIPKEHGTVVFCGCLQWEYIGRRNNKAVPSLMHYTPRLLKPLVGIKVAYVAAHCSSAHAVIVTAEGKAMTFGRNEKGQLGVGDAEVHGGINIVEALKDLTIVQAAVGRNHSLFLTNRGSVFACGDNKSGQCGVDSTTAVMSLPSKISFKESIVVKVACGADFSMILDEHGFLYSFGLSEYGQLGHNTDGKFFATNNKLCFECEMKPRKVPVYIERGRDGHPSPISDVRIVDVSCGSNHSVAVDSLKRAYSWGFGGYGRLGHADPKDEMMPRLIKFFEGPKRGVDKVFCGATFTVGMTQAGIYLWGQTKRTGEANMYPKPVQDLFGWEVRDIGCSATSIVVAADRSVISWGCSPTYGELGLGENVKSSTQPKEVKTLDGAFIHMVSCSLGFTLMIVKDEDEEDKKVLSNLKEVEM